MLFVVEVSKLESSLYVTCRYAIKTLKNEGKERKMAFGNVKQKSIVIVLFCIKRPSNFY